LVYVVDIVALGRVFPENFRCTQSAVIPSVLHIHLSIAWWTVDPLKATVPQSSSFILPHVNKENADILWDSLACECICPCHTEKWLPVGDRGLITSS